MKTELHCCEVNAQSDGYGSAVDRCKEKENGQLWVENSEYATQVNFCPFCGYKAKVELTIAVDWYE